MYDETSNVCPEDESIPFYVEKVRVRNRDINPSALLKVAVTVSGQLCGYIPNTGASQYAEVTCDLPLLGTNVRLTST